jgi:cellulose biosynthesis protein BcsQ
MVDKSKLGNDQNISKIPQTRVFFFLGDKGGVGKSLAARAATDLLIASQIPVAIIDTDTRNPDVERMFAESILCARADIKNDEGWMDVMDIIFANQNKTIVINTPAGLGNAIDIGMKTLTTFAESLTIPLQIELVWVLSTDPDGINLLNQAFSAYGQAFKIHVLCNTHFATSDNNPEKTFELWNKSPLRQKIEQFHKTHTTYFPPLHVRVIKKMDLADTLLTYSQAADPLLSTNIGLTASERHKLLEWLTAAKTALSPIFVS